MYLRRVDVQNFRLLRDVSLLLEPQTTLVVGRNNSGKTSLTELLRRLLVDQRPAFKLEDFSLAAHNKFWQAAQLIKAGAEISEVRDALPVIKVKLTITYEKDAVDLGPLSECIIDLDPDCTDAVIVVAFEPSAGMVEALLEGLGDDGDTEDERKKNLLRGVKERLGRTYAVSVHAQDPGDPSNQKRMELTQLTAIVRADLISAQRGLDDVTTRDRDVLGRILRVLFETADANGATPDDKTTADKLKEAVEDVQRELDQNVAQHMNALLPTFSLFGYPGLSDPGLVTETELDVEQLLQNHTKIRYSGANGLTLPEGYNGLGARNLIYILLQLLSFFRTFNAAAPAPAIHLVFIEEPEAHLHPQMQEVFVRQIEKVAGVFSQMDGGRHWPVQFVMSTHSPHLANAAPFETLRYFLANPDDLLVGAKNTRVKDLRDGLGGAPADDRNFLHQYLTIARCDLFFADKAILIEGTTERLLLPEMIKKVDSAAPASPSLGSQYVTVMEVGGAYAHKFFALLDFLELRALIITDIDAVDANGHACRTSKGSGTSNACIRHWFGDLQVSPAELVVKGEAERVSGIRRLAYQVPDGVGGPCGRSFEDAFMLANPNLFGLEGTPPGEVEEKAFDLAKGVKKSAFALQFAIDEKNWTTPLYIAEGLRWLACEPLAGDLLGGGAAHV